MNTKALIPLVVGLGVAGIALKLGMDFVKRARGAPSETAQVWTANQDIPRGVLVQEHMIQAIKYPTEPGGQDARPTGSLQPQMHTDRGDANEFDRMNRICEICRVGLDPSIRGAIGASIDSRLRGNDTGARRRRSTAGVVG